MEIPIQSFGNDFVYLYNPREILNRCKLSLYNISLDLQMYLLWSEVKSQRLIDRKKAHRGGKKTASFDKREPNIFSAFTITPLALTFKTWNVWENYISVKSSGILSKYNRPGTDFWMRTFDHLWPGLVDNSAVVIKTIRWELDKRSCISHPCHALCVQIFDVLSIIKILFTTTKMAFPLWKSHLGKH